MAGMASIMPVQPPMICMKIAETAQSIGVVKVRRPRTMVSAQSKTFTPVGMATSIVDTL